MNSLFKSVTSYYKYKYATFSQPTLNANGTLGGTAFAVSGTFNQNPGNAWYAFHTTSGYTSPYYVGNYGNEYGSSVELIVYNPIPLKITKFSFYMHYVNSRGDWGAFKSVAMAGSDSNGSYSNIYTYTNPNQDLKNFTVTLTTNSSVYRKYHRFTFTTIGSGHRDEIDISSVRLTAQSRETIAGTSTDYDYTVVTPYHYCLQTGTTYKAIGT